MRIINSNIIIYNIQFFKRIFKFYINGDWGLGIGDWGLGIGPNPQSPIPNPQSPIPNPQTITIVIHNYLLIELKIKLNLKWKKYFANFYQT